MKKSMMRKVFGAMIVTCIVTAPISQADNQRIVLTSRILEIVDGMSIGINGEIIGIILQVRKKVLDMMEGKRAADGSYQGLYECECKTHSIRTLVTVEEELESNIKMLTTKMHNANNKDEKGKIEAELIFLRQRQSTLKECLELVKEDFQAAVCPFLSNARNTKEPMIILITESCEKRNRPDSLLLDWAQMEGEEETESFNKQVTSFAILYLFCDDLANFLGDLTRSCPKAFRQFMEMKKKWEEEQKKQRG